VALRRRRNREGLPQDQADALRRLVSVAKFELIPLKNARDQAALLPAGTTVTVTASPSHGIESTIDLAEWLQTQGHAAVPHLSAHMIRDRGHLDELLARCRDAGFLEAFVVGGDAKDPGEFREGLTLLRAMDEAGHPFAEVGVPGYPEGHVDIPRERLLEVLRAKQPYATYMTTQMCFNPGSIVAWIRGMREAGVGLPVHLGTPGVAEIGKLMTISARIGIADSARYLKKNRRMVGHLLSPGSFGPDALLEGLAPSICEPDMDIESLHLFTFNQVGATVEWRDRFLGALAPEEA
jgi:methylenetetrahydrofolate reductase (NADPH)